MSDHAGETRFITTSDLAKLLGIHHTTVRKLYSDGRIAIPCQVLIQSVESESVNEPWTTSEGRPSSMVSILIRPLENE